MTAAEPEDGLLDLLAAVQAARDGRTADLHLIREHGDHEYMLIAAIRVLAELAGETGASADEFRTWGVRAWSRGR